MKTKPEHYADTLDALTAYRSARFLLNTPLDETAVEALGADVEKIKESYTQAQNIAKTIEKAFLNLKLTHIDGHRLSRIIYLRYMTESPMSEAEIINILSSEGIAKTRQTYQRLKETAQILICKYIWGNDIKEKTMKDINIPAKTAI